MQITFNPLVQAEADAVRRMLALKMVDDQEYGEAFKDGFSNALQRVKESRTDVNLGRRDTDTPAAPVSFQPGDMSGSAPSPADAAPSPTAPEVPQGGVPVPPSAASVPAPPSTAPEVPAAPTTSAPSGELDVNGLPWDERIHASSKTRNADGSWRQRRNLSPVTLETVTAELRARAANRRAYGEPIPYIAELRARAANPGNAALGDDAAKLAGLGMDPLSGQPLPTGGYVSAPPPMAASVPPPPVTTVAAPPAPAAPDALTYDGFLAWVTPKMMDGSSPFDKVAAALSASGVSSLQELRDNPAAIPAVYAALGGV